MRVLIVVAAVGSAVAFGQAAPEFDVASVKAMPPVCRSCKVNNAMRIRGGPGTDDPGRIDYNGITVERLLVIAYGMQKSQIFGPDWLDSERFSIQAQLPQGTSKESFSLMLQNLLAMRLELALHREKKRYLSVYIDCWQ